MADYKSREQAAEQERRDREAVRRYTCRDQAGRVRLTPGVTLMEALEQLLRIEERAFGLLTVPVADTVIWPNGKK